MLERVKEKLTRHKLIHRDKNTPHHLDLRLGKLPQAHRLLADYLLELSPVHIAWVVKYLKHKRIVVCVNIDPPEEPHTAQPH